MYWPPSISGFLGGFPVYLYKKRRWLNRLGQHTVGFVYGRVEQERWTSDEDGPITHRHVNTTGQLTIGDCSRMITLDFEADANSLRKLDILIDVMTSMRDLLEQNRKKETP